MVKKQMQLLFKKHSDWIKIVNSFGEDPSISEDLVQEMYIKIQLKLEKGLDISYGDEINYYYIFKTLRTLFLDLKRKGKNIKRVSADNIKAIDDRIDYEKNIK